jgi:SAM-dependent methyltransferase
MMNKKDGIQATLSLTEKAKIWYYLMSGRKPFGRGYAAYKKGYILDVLGQADLMVRFRQDERLPPGYGFGLDERAVEFPWVLSRICESDKLMLDAGSALNHDFVLSRLLLRDKTIVIYTLAPDGETYHHFDRSVSYMYGDLRQTILKSESFDCVTCISTLEHIGMDNTNFYVNQELYREKRVDDYLVAVEEMWRLIKKGGRLFITVPYGRGQQLGWLQQFDAPKVDRIRRAIPSAEVEEAYYLYSSQGWNVAASEECQHAEYYDYHAGTHVNDDCLAAARAVVCLAFTK